MATRRGREERSEVGLVGGDTDKARTGHGRRREEGWQRWQRAHGLRLEGLRDGGVRTYNWGGGSQSSFHLERRGSNLESSSEEKREDGNHLVTLPRRDG